jgi:hypothetical protein
VLDEGLHILYFSPNVTNRMIRSWGIRRTVHVTGVEEPKMHTDFQLENLKSRADLEGLGVDEKIICKWILEIGWKSIDWLYLAWDKGSTW